jgi:hypothetical protein
MNESLQLWKTLYVKVKMRYYKLVLGTVLDMFLFIIITLLEDVSWRPKARSIRSRYSPNIIWALNQSLYVF